MPKLKFKAAFSCLLVFAALFSTSFSSIGLAQTPSDPLVELPGSMSPDLGTPASQPPGKSALDPSSVTIVLAPRNEAAYSALAQDVSDPSSPRYRHFITDAEYRQNYAPDQATISNLKNYYAGQGLTLGYESSSGLVFSFKGTQGQIDQVFNTTSEYRADSQGETGLINVTPLKLPASLAKTIKGVLGFDRLHQVHPTSVINESGVSKDSLSYNTPASFRTAFNVPLDLDGSGTTPAITIYGAPNASDITRWKTDNSLTGGSITILGNTSKSDDDWLSEGNLDLTMIFTAAPRADVKVFSAYSNYYSDFAVALQNAIDANVSTINGSWGGCDNVVGSSTRSSYHTIFQHAAAKGIPVFFSSGDSGVFQCSSTSSPTLNVGYANFPSTDDLVASIGATALDRDSSTNAWLNEVAWSCNDPAADSSCFQSVKGSSGGGQASVTTRPAYQSSITPPTEAKFTFHPPTNTRVTPDISSAGDPKTSLLIYGTFYGHTDYYHIGGTSASSPFLSGIVALAVQKFRGPVGAINPFIYSHFSTTWGFDVISGNNGVNAHPGWDYTTGQGSIKDTSAFVNAFTSNLIPTITSVTPNVLNAGGPAFTLDVYGTGFASGAIIKWDSLTPATTFVSGHLLTAAIPSSYIVGAGTPSITVVNPGPDLPVSNAVLITVSASCVNQVVTQTGDGSTCSYLRFAIPHADTTHPVNIALGAGQTITLNSTGSALTVPAGITINGVCTASGPGITINGSATTNNIVLSGGTTLVGVSFTGFNKPGFSKMLATSGTSGGANKFLCSSVKS